MVKVPVTLLISIKYWKRKGCWLAKRPKNTDVQYRIGVHTQTNASGINMKAD
jgi:hypothetical protein